MENISETILQAEILKDLPSMTIDHVVFICRQDDQFMAGQYQKIPNLQTFFANPRPYSRFADWHQLRLQNIRPFEATSTRAEMARWFAKEYENARESELNNGPPPAVGHPLISHIYRWLDRELRQISIGGRGEVAIEIFQILALSHLEQSTRVHRADGRVPIELFVLAGDFIRSTVTAIYLYKGLVTNLRPAAGAVSEMEHTPESSPASTLYDGAAAGG